MQFYNPSLGFKNEDAEVRVGYDWGGSVLFPGHRGPLGNLYFM